MNDKLKMIRLACVAGFIITVGTIGALSVVLAPPSVRSIAFYLRILWAEMLGIAVWGSLYALLAAPLCLGESKQGIGRVAPAVVGVVIGYAILSLALLVASSVLPNIDWLSRIHLAVQIVLAAVALVTILLMGIAVVYGQRDAAPSQRTPPASPT